MALLDGKAIIVTGAGRGLGRAYALALAAAGAQVAVNDIDLEGARRVVGEIRAAGGTAIESGEDVADWAAAKELVDRCVEAFGKLDVLVNNAGRMIATRFVEETPATIDATLRVNVTGVINMTRHAVDHMIPRGGGNIINVSSGSQCGIPGGWAVYGASKAAVAGFTYNCAIELAEHNIRVNAISPNAATRVSEAEGGEAAIPRARRPSSMAPLVVYLASDESWWITGQVFRLQDDRFSLFGHPKPLYPEHDPDGWTAEGIRAHVAAKLRHRLEPVGIGVTEYTYDRVLRKP
jgi:NAD(P)-dependent dehydrogenase (short-subunit alcohol dehydrogenase family)